MVSRFQHGVEYIAVFDEMPTPAPITDVDPCSRHIVDRTASYGNASRHRNLHGCGLLLKPTAPGDQAILDDAVARIILRSWSRIPIQRGIICDLIVVVQRITNGLRISNKSHAIGATFADQASSHGDASVVIIDKDCVTTELIKIAIFDCDVFGTMECQRSAAVGRPIGTQ